MGACMACGIFENWQQATDGYSAQILALLSPYAMPLLVAALGLFWTLRITRYIGGAEMDVAELGKEIVMTTIASTFLTWPSMWGDLVDTLLTTSTELARFLIDPIGTPTRTGLSGLLYMVDEPLYFAVSGARGIMNGTGLTEIGLFIGALILLLVYAVLWGFIIWDAAWFYAKFVFLKALGPILLVALAMPATRGTMVQAYKIGLTAILQFCSLGITIGIAVYMLRAAMAHMPISPDGSVTGDASDYLFGEEYLSALFYGVLLIFLRGAFQHLASQLADSVTNSAPSLSGLARGVQSMVRGLKPSGKAAA